MPMFQQQTPSYGMMPTGPVPSWVQAEMMQNNQMNQFGVNNGSFLGGGFGSYRATV
jgi:hypothetical protein